MFLLDVSAADIEAGLLDNAEAVTFLVNSDDPDLYQRVLRSGWMGNTTRTAEGQYKTEMRGLTQALSQGIVRTYSVGCDAELFGDAAAGSTAALHYRRLASRSPPPAARQFQVNPGDIPTIIRRRAGGKITWTSGLNTGYVMEMKSYVSLKIVTLYLPMPNDIEVGDTFDFSRRLRQDARDVHQQLQQHPQLPRPRRVRARASSRSSKWARDNKCHAQAA